MSRQTSCKSMHTCIAWHHSMLTDFAVPPSPLAVAPLDYSAAGELLYYFLAVVLVNAAIANAAASAAAALADIDKHQC